MENDYGVVPCVGCICCIQACIFDIRACMSGCSLKMIACCTQSDCICCGRPDDAQDNIICVCSRLEELCVSPRACLLCSGTFSCTTCRAAFPCTVDVPCMINLMGLTLCYKYRPGCMCCKTMTQLNEGQTQVVQDTSSPVASKKASSGNGDYQEVKANNYGTVPCCGGLCCVTNLICDIRACCGGGSLKGVLCCADQACACCVRPNSGIDTALLVCCLAETLCKKPDTCLGSSCACSCFECRSAFPCNQDVPCILNTLGINCCYKYKCACGFCSTMSQLDEKIGEVQEKRVVEEKPSTDIVKSKPKSEVIKTVYNPEDDEEDVFEEIEYDIPILPNMKKCASTSLEPEEALLSVKAMALSKFAYLQDDPEETNPEQMLEEKWAQGLQVKDYCDWYVPLSSDDAAKQFGASKKTTEMFKLGASAATDAAKLMGQEKALLKKVGGSRAVSGVVNDLTGILSGSTYFVSFRGTASISDMISDLTSITKMDFVTLKGSNLGYSGKGMVEQYMKLRDQVKLHGKTLMQLAIEKAKATKNGLLITGHSLGAAVATIFAAEILQDYKGQFPVRLITFGGPRVFNSKTSVWLHDELKDHLRFINRGDVITIMGSELTAQVGEAGKKAGAAAAAAGAAAFNAFSGNENAKKKPKESDKEEDGPCILEHVGTPVFCVANQNQIDNKNFVWEKLSTKETKDLAPDYEGYIQTSSAVMKFIANHRAHLIDKKTGYQWRLLQCPSYLEGLSTLNTKQKETFERIPFTELKNLR